jgi:hypothetical protein
MSTFTTPADLRIHSDYNFELLKPFEYHIGSFPSENVIVVPAGFVTDLTSVPRFLWALLPPHGKYAKAAIIHDYLYEYAIKNKQYADKVFLEAMEVLGVPYLQRKLMYLAVKVFGKGNYKENK